MAQRRVAAGVPRLDADAGAEGEGAVHDAGRGQVPGHGHHGRGQGGVGRDPEGGHVRADAEPGLRQRRGAVRRDRGRDPDRAVRRPGPAAAARRGGGRHPAGLRAVQPRPAGALRGRVRGADCAAGAEEHPLRRLQLRAARALRAGGSHLCLHPAQARKGHGPEEQARAGLCHQGDEHHCPARGDGRCGQRVRGAV